MKPPLLSSVQLAGVDEKLKRADETIRNLNSEIVAFLNERPEGGFSEDKQQAARQLAEFHAKREIPLRFGVIAGEIAHHLRSSLEHIAWMLSSDPCRLDPRQARHIGFPILTLKPAKDEPSSYRRQVKGILDKGALSLIERLQPYNAANPADDPLSILHELDRKDKHHTLVLIVSQWSAALTLPPLGTFTISGLDRQKEWAVPASAKNSKLEFTPYIAFDQFGGGKTKAVIPALTHLLNAVRDIVRLFSELTI